VARVAATPSCKCLSATWHDEHTARRIIGGAGDGPLQFKAPRQICVASDGFVFIADHGNGRVQVLSPDLTFHRFIGEGQLHDPSGVCANADIVVVSQTLFRQISVFRRDDGALVRHFSSQGRPGADGKLLWPASICFLPSDRHIAVADPNRGRVSIFKFSVDGDFKFIRNVGVGVLRSPRAVACSAYGELVVVGSNCICVIDSNDRVWTLRVGDGRCSSVAVHGCTVVALSQSGRHCVVLE
jgi:hypothetical protein